jgi:hypothetical protein
MPLTAYQRRVCRLLAAERVSRGERYVAGGAALNELLAAPRVSNDVDLFHDAAEAVLASWAADRQTLLRAGHDVQPLREFPTFVEAEVRMGADGVILQWVQDSAFRFFPLVEHPDFGLALHPFDLATNKVLALVGRAEVRDWVDIIHCHAALQPFGYLVWAASGKDPGLSPAFIIEQAGRSAHYSKPDLATLAFDGRTPDIEELGKRWRTMLREADDTASRLPEDRVGTCVLTRNGELLRVTGDALASAVENDAIIFHEGSIRGAWPRLRPDGQGAPS